MAEAVGGSDRLVVGVPSHSFRAVLEEAKRHLRPWVPVISLTKGLEIDHEKRMTELIEDILAGHPVGVLTGPNLARENPGGPAAAQLRSLEAQIERQGGGEGTGVCVMVNICGGRNDKKK